MAPASDPSEVGSPSHNSRPQPIFRFRPSSRVAHELAESGGPWNMSASQAVLLQNLRSETFAAHRDELNRAEISFVTGSDIMVEGGKKKNKNRGKNRNKATAAAPETARTDSTSSETVVEPRPTPQKAQSPSPLVASAPPVQTAPAAQGGGATAAQNALLKNLALDQPPHPGWFEVKRAEASYYRASPPKVETARPKPAQLAAEESDAIDLLGSDDELRAQPPTVQPVPRGPARKKVDPASQAHFQNGSSTKAQSGSLAAEIAKARQHIKNSLECVDNLTAMAGSQDLVQKIQKLENDNKNLQKVCDDLKNLVLKLDKRVQGLETGNKGAPAKTATKDDDDDDVDLFGSESDEEEDADKVRIREERLKAYHEKKSKKPTLIAKTSVLLDVKPWDDETDMDAMLAAVKTIKKDGLLWGASKLVPVGYGIKKLQVMCVVEDEKVSIDELCEQIAEFEDFVQSADISSMSKI
eukprot:maker-scaffold275_size226830-snap-gene-0.30 protein:Tk00627 transcript:maker-scaffold275_size226830-snap-gene-0.30-mRNA-1 annotation:"elongation factor 1-delta"